MPSDGAGGSRFGVLDLVSGAVSRLNSNVRPSRAADIHWVGADGTVLVVTTEGSAGLEPAAGCGPVDEPDPMLTLFSPAGSALWTVRGGRGVDSVIQAGEVLLIAMPEVNTSLLTVDTRTGRAREVLEGHDFEVLVDGNGSRIAIRYTPLSAAYTALMHGATPLP
jgi:hypothetical protein